MMGKTYSLFVYRSVLTGGFYKVNIYGDVEFYSIRRGWITCQFSYQFLQDQPHFEMVAKHVVFKCPA